MNKYFFWVKKKALRFMNIDDVGEIGTPFFDIEAMFFV